MTKVMRTYPPSRIIHSIRQYWKTLAYVLVVVIIAGAPCRADEFRLTEVSRINLPINARAIAWHPDSKTLAAGGWGGMLTVWDALSHRLVRDLNQTNGVVESVEFSGDGKFLAVGKSAVRNGAYLTIFDTATYAVIDARESPNVKSGRNSPSLRSISLDPKTSRRIAVLGYEHEWDPVIFTIGPTSANIVEISAKPKHFVKGVAFNPKLEQLAVSRLNGSIDFYSSQDGRLVSSLTAYENWSVQALVFSRDGRFLYTGSDTGVKHGYRDRETGQWHSRQNNEPIKMWDIQTLRLVRTFNPDGAGTSSLAVSPDGRYLYAGLVKRLKVWNVKTASIVEQFDASGALLVMPSSDGKYLATTDTGTRVVRIWSVATQ